MYLNAIRKRFADDQDIKTLVVICLTEILKATEEELVECLDTILEMLVEIDFNKNSKLYMLSKEAGEKLRSKVLYYLETNKEVANMLINIIVACINKYFERENSNIKKWVLAWFYFLLNIDEPNIFLSLWMHLVDLINLLPKYDDEEIINVTENLIQELLNKFKRYESSISKNICFNLCKRLLDNFNEYELEPNQQLLSLDWIIASFETGIKGDVSSVDAYVGCNNLEDILVNCLQLIIDNQQSSDIKIKERLNTLNCVLLANLENADKLLEDKQDNRFYNVLSLFNTKLKSADLVTIQFIIKWLERIFELNSKLFEANIDDFIAVLDSEAHAILNYIMTFMANLVNGLQSKDVIYKIVNFYTSHNRKDAKIKHFIDFIKILMPTSVNAIKIFIEIVSLLLDQADDVYLLKVIDSFQSLYVTDPNFAFLRDFIKHVKLGKLSPSDKEHYAKIVELWSRNYTASYALCIASGKYKTAYRIILWLAQNNIRKHSIDQLHAFIRMMETPYFAYIRIDLLKYNQ